MSTSLDPSDIAIVRAPRAMALPHDPSVHFSMDDNDSDDSGGADWFTVQDDTD
ncbi:hypothetical protein [Streptomyces sp. NBC_01276]|uniref:hypothetical protein n=1 Tax=Streptomyces sp. NBC_01276 TaxID=2903808 RepID=UPI00352DCDA2